MCFIFTCFRILLKREHPLELSSNSRFMVISSNAKTWFTIDLQMISPYFKNTKFHHTFDFDTFLNYLTSFNQFQNHFTMYLITTSQYYLMVVNILLTYYSCSRFKCLKHWFQSCSFCKRKWFANDVILKWCKSF